MKSDVIHVSADGAGTAEALRQAEAVAVYKSLSKKDSMHLQLLAGEMMGMMKGLTGNREADFWIDTEGASVRLHLKAGTMMTAEMRQKLMAVSTSGKNAAVKGVMGKISDLFSRILEPADSSPESLSIAGWNAVDISAGMIASGINVSGRSMSITPTDVWSFNRYKDSVKNGEETEAWDELEKSIVANIADEIEIGIADGAVEMIIYKNCTED